LEKVNRTNGEITSIELAYQNSGSQKARGADFGLQYQRQTQFGTFTSLTQATFLDSFQFSQLPGETEIELRSTGAGVSDEAHLKWKANSQLDWAWQSFDLGATAHYLDGFHEILAIDRRFPDSKKEHYVKETWFFDVQASYNLTFAAPIEAQPVPGVSTNGKTDSGKNVAEAAVTQAAAYEKPCWKMLLNNTKITLGCNNVFGHDPPDALTNSANYPGFLYDATGRFVYVSLTKKF
jgi:outer membrane receptor protein involved in Fe transport